MAPPRKKSSQGKSRKRGPIVRPGKTPRFISPDEIYASAERAYSTNGPEALLRHCERERAKKRLHDYCEPNNPMADWSKGKIKARWVGVSGGANIRPRLPSGVGWHLLGIAVPVIKPLYAASPTVRSLLHAGPEFFGGFASELRKPDITRLARLIRKDPTDLLTTPLLFSAGAVYGVATDLLDSLKFFYDLVFHSYAMGKAIYDLVKAILADPNYARELGKQVGSQITKSMNELFGLSLNQFAFEIGKLLGPMLFYTVLAIVGFPYAGLMRFGTFLMRSKTIFKAVKAVDRAIPDELKVALRTTTDLLGPFDPTLGFKKASGMTQQHYNIVLARAKSNDRVIGIRCTNNASTHWIEKGHGAKPFGINANTDPTGFVIADGKFIKEAHKKGFYVVGDDLTKATRVTKKNGVTVKTETVDLTGARWPVAKGQIIPDTPPHKALVGDYDGQDLIDLKSPGSNVSLVVDNEIEVKDVRGVGRDGIGVTKVLDELNADFLATGGQIRIMHGFEGNYKYYKGSVVFFFPDGKTLLLTERQVMEWYRQIKRRTRNESWYPNVTPFTPEQLKKMAAANDGKPKLH